MRQVAIAFNVTGSSPKSGHRISELVGIEQLHGQPTGRSACMLFKSDAAPDAKTFAEQLDGLDKLIGDAVVIVHDGGLWRKFLRVELQGIKKRGVRRLLTQVLDVGDWAHEQFPRQRRDLPAIAKRLGVEVPRELSGLQGDAELLRLIATKMNPTAVAIAPSTGLPSKGAPISVGSPHTAQRSFSERVDLCWRVLIGRA